MNDKKFKPRQIVYIICSDAASVAGGNIYDVEIVSLSDKLLCELRHIGCDETFTGDIRALHPTRQEAIDLLIKQLIDDNEDQ